MNNHCVSQITEAAGRRDELEDVVWSHFENVIVPEAMKYQMLDHDEPVTSQVQVAIGNWY